MIYIDKRIFKNKIKDQTNTIGVGIGTGRPAITDIALEFPVGHRIPYSSYEQIDNQIHIIGFFPHTLTGNFAITEAGIFSESGELLCREIDEPKSWGCASALKVEFLFEIEE